MKKEYISATLQVFCINKQDVICTSNEENLEFVDDVYARSIWDVL